MTDKDTAPVAYEGPKDIIVHDNGEFSNWLDTARFNHLWRIATVFSRCGDMVPEQFRNNPESCMIAVQMAFRLQVDPLMFLQKSYVIYGKPGIEATLAIALCNSHGPFKGPIQYEWSGEEGKDNWTCTAFAIHKETGERCEMPLDMKTVKAEGWYGKKGSKWVTMPRLMFMYRSSMWMIRAFCPEVILGMHSADELRDSGGDIIDVEPVAEAEDLAERMAANKEQEPEPAQDGFQQVRSGTWTELKSLCEFLNIVLKAEVGPSTMDGLGLKKDLAESDAQFLLNRLRGLRQDKLNGNEQIDPESVSGGDSGPGDSLLDGMEEPWKPDEFQNTMLIKYGVSAKLVRDYYGNDGYSGMDEINGYLKEIEDWDDWAERVKSFG